MVPGAVLPVPGAEPQEQGAAKTGRSHSLELNKLSNLMSHAAMAHPNKARTSLSASLRGQRPDQLVHLSRAQRAQLREVFMYYCAWADKGNYTRISRTQFLRCCRDAGLQGHEVDSVQLNLLYERAVLEAQSSGSGATGTRLTLKDWLVLLERVAAKLHPDMQEHEAATKVIMEHVLPLSSRIPPREDPLAEVVQQEGVRNSLAAVTPRLRQIFRFYVNEQEFSSSGTAGLSWQELQQARSRMPLETFLRFAQDFEVVPNLLVAAQLVEAFKSTRLETVARAAARDDEEAGQDGEAGPHEEEEEEGGDEDLERIGFPEFMEVVGRLALMAYKFTIPKAPSVYLGFHASYQSEAKQLWLDAERQQMEEARLFPDEAMMPSAILEDGIGNEDSPHWDDVMSRAPSRAGIFTRAKSIVGNKAKMRSSPGLEVLQIHDEQDTLPPKAERPAHLSAYSSDWIGRPGLPLNQMASLRVPRVDPLKAKGWYRADADVPPKYTGRMEHMIVGRVLREQAVEVMKLGLMAENRQALKESVAQRAAMREYLQTLSGQPVAGNGLLSWQRSHTAPASTSGRLAGESMNMGTTGGLGNGGSR
eukprot:CAMPEP_0202905200 /NCGR_PEP_ID=MMETSP1392-20130828/33035_1 /ASSEMBLY_ACC=CAM_ASM_000868 /TAXON_ID=225041 /ORGANISM="Chlamydomonas chlamydogama, Strain SAG 11-48b" /LENGTH=589 /DNA_ID=CAMNT_0049593179 /DNA_START=145 /DNA_END=1912 /DNA_ORIENTATION=+